MKLCPACAGTKCALCAWTGQAPESSSGVDMESFRPAAKAFMGVMWVAYQEGVAVGFTDEQSITLALHLVQMGMHQQNVHGTEG